MLYLAIDTCLAACSVAVIERADSAARGQVVAGLFERMATGPAERLFPMIDQVMRDAGLAYRQLSGLAVTTGPGTFTGVRLGVAAARGLALAAGLPVFTATSLALVAAAARAEVGDRVVLAVADARNAQVFGQSFGPSGAALDEPRLLTVGEAALGCGETTVVAGSAAALVAVAVEEGGRRVAGVVPMLEPDARAFAEVAIIETAHPRPLYLRPPDAKPQDGKSLPWA